MRMHIITASKGGTGKTGFACSLAAYYINEGKKVLLVDANTNNIDFFSIISRVKHEELSMASKKRQYHIEPINDSFIFSLSKGESKEKTKGLGLVRQQPYDTYQGIGDFYALLTTAKHQAEYYEVDVVIVDTNMCLENLMPTYLFLEDRKKVIEKNNEDESIGTITLNNESQVISELDYVKEHISELFEKTDIYIFYMWCINDFLKTREALGIFDTQEIIGLFSKQANFFDETKQLFHVINNYNNKTYKDFSLVNYIGKKLVGKENSDKHSRFNNDEEIGFTFSEIAQIIRDASHEHYLDKKKNDFKGKEIEIAEKNLFSLTDSSDPRDKHFISRELQKYYLRLNLKGFKGDDFVARARFTNTLFLYTDVSKNLERLGL